jgi:hypothetical protein
MVSTLGVKTPAKVPKLPPGGDDAVASVVGAFPMGSPYLLHDVHCRHYLQDDLKNKLGVRIS